MIRLLKQLFLSRTPRQVRILRGPFRGATLSLAPADSVRKILGLYERELNEWLELALRDIDNVVDVGANDGYFTFGCAAALKSRGRGAVIVAIEPEKSCCEQLIRSKRAWETSSSADVQLVIEQACIGSSDVPGQLTLAAVLRRHGMSDGRTLIKIDVEGAELDVLDGAEAAIKPGNLFLIEVHRAADVPVIAERFESLGSKLVHVKQRPLWLLGPEMRDAANSWLVSQI